MPIETPFNSTDVIDSAESERVYDTAESSMSDNTLLAYSQQWRKFAGWCEERNRVPLPASAYDTAAYLTKRAERAESRQCGSRRRPLRSRTAAPDTPARRMTSS